MRKIGEKQMKKYDVTALGELLIDFTENGTSAQGNPIMEANPGGAPCNVLAMLGKLGQTTAFIGKVGRDFFGDQLEAAVREVGIDTLGLKRDPKVHTTLAFVHTYEDGDRDFSFYRDPGADMLLSVDDLEEELLTGCRMFHFGTIPMTHPGCRQATYTAIRTAKGAGALISFDPNIREPLWESMEEAREQTLYGIGQCDILKISDNEIVWLTGLADYAAGAAWIKERFPNVALLLVSAGKEGSYAFTKTESVFVPAFLQETTIETTGAGDTFCACILHAALEVCEKAKTPEEKRELLAGLGKAELAQMLTFANAAASIVTTRRGSLRVMPEACEAWALARTRSERR